jgi:hypothetical protein
MASSNDDQSLFVLEDNNNHPMGFQPASCHSTSSSKDGPFSLLSTSQPHWELSASQTYDIPDFFVSSTNQNVSENETSNLAATPYINAEYAFVNDNSELPKRKFTHDNLSSLTEESYVSLQQRQPEGLSVGSNKTSVPFIDDTHADSFGITTSKEISGVSEINSLATSLSLVDRSSGPDTITTTGVASFHPEGSSTLEQSM